MLFWENLIVVIVSVLVPIIPAYLLYKLLPSTGSVEGPFQGLQIKLGGAFAGYFLVLLVIIAFWKTQNTNYEVWKVSGWTNFEGGDNLDKTKVFILVNPSPTLQSDGTFQINVLKQANATGEMDLPTLVVDQPAAEYNYQPAPVHLTQSTNSKFPNSYHITIPKWWTLTPNISIDEPIVIKKKETVQLPSYTANAPAPKPLAAAPTPPPAPGGSP